MEKIQSKPAVTLRRGVSVKPFITPRESILDLVEEMVQKGGPEPDDYELLDLTLASMPHYLENNIISQDDLKAIIAMCDFLHTPDTFMGHSKLKPYGYAGDYAIIEKIYNQTVCEQYAKWDLYSYNHPAAAAVRNRKAYFQQILTNRLSKHQGELRLLNIASGPARDLFELYSSIAPETLHTTCVEYDKRAIAYASALCENYLQRISFHNKNIFKFNTDEQFDVVWSAGLFDYFDDRTFVTLLGKFIHDWAGPKGEVIIGNFCTSNPSRPYMELFGEWHLNHRSADHLYRLAIEAGAEVGNIYIDKEPEGVNLFLRIQK